MSEAKTLKKAKIRYTEYYNMTEVQDELYQSSKEGKKFANLMEIISSRENILLAYRTIKKNGGSSTPSVDRLTIKDIEKLEENEYVQAIQRRLQNYQPKKVKRVEIPKPNGKTRPLGIPSIWDRLVQQCVLQVLEPICEAKFYEYSFGFRPNRSTEHAIAYCYKLIQLSNLHYVVDIDIKGFFDNVNHGKLLKQMWHMGIRDKNLIFLISKMLKAPIKHPNGKVEHPIKGTPQGGILSPLLSNIVLNELDWWIASQWENIPTVKTYTQGKPKANGTIRKGNKYAYLRRTTKLKECFIVRYADDFKIFCRNYDDARRLYVAVKNWLKDRLGLEISEEKSKIVNLRTHYSEYLGYKMKVTHKNGKYVVKSYIANKALKRIECNLKEAIPRIARANNTKARHAAVGMYNSMVIGIHNYYCKATHVSLSLGTVGYKIHRIFKTRQGIRGHLKKKGKLNKFLQERYGKSKQVRYLDGQPIIPIGYVHTKNPMNKRKEVNRFTPEGRKLIHKQLGANIHIIHWLMEHPIKGQSIEYNDNRLSLYSAQNGKCAITGVELTIDQIHCHHKTPRSLNGTDEYKNLIIVHKLIHKAIHSKDEKEIKNILIKFQIEPKGIKKFNDLRKKCQLEAIEM